MNNILDKIIADKKNAVKQFKKIFTIEHLKKKISFYKNYLDFKAKLMEKKISVIAEIKKASPSAGVIIQNYDPKIIAKQYSKFGA